jgi:hypothetical protein
MIESSEARAPLIAADDKAWVIFDELKARGLPVIGATGTEGGRKIAVSFQLADQAAKYTVRCSTGEATADWFQRMYEVVA